MDRRSMIDSYSNFLLWTHPQPSGNDINPNTPMYNNGMIFPLRDTEAEHGYTN